MRTFQGLWVGPRLSPVEKLAIASFVANGYGFNIYAYGPLEGIPDGARLCDANDIIPEREIFRGQGNRLSAFSDYFRWKLLHDRGGIWVDLDMVCLRRFDFDDDVIFGYEDAHGQLGTAILGFPPRHPLTSVIHGAFLDVNALQPIDTLKTVVKKSVRAAMWGNAGSRPKLRFSEPGGPAYFTKFANYYGYIGAAKPQTWFYPIAYPQWRDMLRPATEMRPLIEKSYCIHLWNDILRADPSIDKQKLNVSGSMIGELFQRYGVEP